MGPNKMVTNMKILTVTLTFLVTVSALARDFVINPEDAVIVLPEQADPIRVLAASELQKHLQLVSGRELPLLNSPTPGKYAFIIAAPKDETLDKEEARWETSETQTYLYGDDFLLKPELKSIQDICSKYARTGTLFAVYDFLEKQLGILWLEPGDRGIVYTAAETIKLRIGKNTWRPGRLLQRQIRSGYLSWYSNPRVQSMISNTPEFFRPTREQYEESVKDTQLWLKRQKMGVSFPFGYGHAFTQWWKQYGKEHPEYFALQENGVRGPADKRDHFVKLCVSNPKVHEQIISNWQNAKNPSLIINTCENDSHGYCHCPECCKLDVRLEGEAFAEHLTDRYVWFSNAVKAKAEKINPQAGVVMYAYSVYRYPPRREKVDPAIIIGFVPSMLELDTVEEMYRGWRQAGAEKLLLRPNDQHLNAGIPMGFEKQLFEHFQLGIKNGIVGSDYDSLHNFWPANGIADYILARAHTAPEQSFEHWEDEYCSAFGAAANEVKNYFRYWREQIWEKKILPDRKNIRERGRYGNFRRGLMWSIDKYYQSADFDRTDAILESATSRDLSKAEKERLGNLRLANRHARLAYLAFGAKAEQKFTVGKTLLEFRSKYRDQLSFNWAALFNLEKQFGDITGVIAASDFSEYLDVRALPLQWQFKIDPQNLGMTEKWETTKPASYQADWSPIRVNLSWEQQVLESMPQELRTQLKNYDGIGYYALNLSVPKDWKNQELFLYFGAVDESAWVYLNGKPAGEHLFEKPDDWKTPFTIRIDQLIDWSQNKQSLVVRVEDKSGDGGIWKPVYLLRK